MKFVTFENEAGVPHVGAVVGDSVVDLTGGYGDTPESRYFDNMIALIAGGNTGLDAARRLIDETADGDRLPLDSVTLLAPIPRPPKNVFCVGLNYRDHIDEGSRAMKIERKLPEVPIFFTKPHTSVTGHEAVIPYPMATEKLDYEAELAVVIGRPARDVPVESALEYVFGYTALNDLSARDLQRRHGQWFKGKALDKCCPMGPWIVTAGEVGDPQDIDVRSRVNGELRQNSNTRYMIFDVATIISSLSAGLTLEPGDIIATGTPAGVGNGFDPPKLLQPGDTVEVEVSRVGILRNTIGPRE